MSWTDWKNRSSTHRTGQRRRRDSFGDDESNLDNQDTNDNRNEGPSEGPEPHEVPYPREEPHRNFSFSENIYRIGRGDDRTGIQKPKKPATYSGKTGWREFLIHFKMVSEFNKWDDRNKAFELALSVRDNAQVTPSDLKPQEWKNFKTVVAALTCRFEPEDQSKLYRSEVKNMFRKKDETLTEFAQDIKRLVRLAYPNTDMDVHATLGRNAFEDSLRDPDMEWAVHEGKSKTIETAVKLALEFEAFRGSRIQQIPIRLNKVTLKVQTEEPVQGKRNDNNSRNRNHGVPRNQKVCIYCGRKGHIEQDCYTKKRAWIKDPLRPRETFRGLGRGSHLSYRKQTKNTKDDACYEGLFLQAEIGGISVTCLIDTGSSISTIHPALYNRMTEKQLLSSSDVRLRMVDGGLVPVCGEVSFSVHIQDATYEQTMVVAESSMCAGLGHNKHCITLRNGGHLGWRHLSSLRNDLFLETSRSQWALSCVYFYLFFLYLKGTPMWMCPCPMINWWSRPV